MTTQTYSSQTETTPTASSTESEGGEGDDGPALPLDVTFGILKNERRRRVLAYMRSADETATIGEIAEHIAAIENDTTVQQLNAQQRKRVYIGLYQCHLPQMDDAGVIDFNQNRGLITLEAPAEELFAYLDVTEEGDDAESGADAEERDALPTTKHYSGLVVGSGVLFVVSLLANELMFSHLVVLLFLCCIVFLAGREVFS